MQASNICTAIGGDIGTIFVAIELSRRSWLVTVHSPDRDRFSRHNVLGGDQDRKSTRLNSSHLVISYAVFCLKKKKKIFNVPSRLHDNIDSKTSMSFNHTTELDRSTM